MRLYFRSLLIPKQSARRLAQLLAISEVVARQWTAQICGYDNWQDLQQATGTRPQSPLDDACTGSELEERHEFQLLKLQECMAAGGVQVDADALLALWRPTASTPRQPGNSESALDQKMRSLLEDDMKQLKRRAAAGDKGAQMDLQHLDDLAAYAIQKTMSDQPESISQTKQIVAYLAIRHMQQTVLRDAYPALIKIHEWHNAAIAGDAQSQYKSALVWDYADRLDIEGPKPQPQTAAALYRKAMKQQHALASICLGRLLQRRPDLANDEGEAEAAIRSGCNLLFGDDHESHHHDGPPHEDACSAIDILIERAITEVNQELGRGAT